MSNEENLRNAERLTEVNISEEQKETGDYKKGTVKINGLNITIENPKNSARSGVDKSGNKWSNKLNNTYGYINNTVGNDGDEIDVFMGDDLDEDFDVYLIAQQDPETKIFDEHKAMLGFKNVDTAISAYFSNYGEGWDGLQSIKRMNQQDFKAWISLRSVLPKQTAAMIAQTKLTIDNYLEGRVKRIILEGEVLEEITLNDLQEQAGSYDDFDTLILEIASNGGSVCEGVLIMLWLNYLSEIGKNVVTIVTANAYSIASLIMLAANLRIISSSADIMVHNPMIPEIKLANANELEAHARGLRELEEIMYLFYQIFTGLEEDEIKILMDNETYLDANKSKEKGFVDEIVELEKRPKAVGVNKQKITKMSTVKNTLHRALAVVTGSNVVNQMYYTDAGDDIEILQKDPSKYAVGDKTSVESGTEKLSDGSLLTIENFEIKTIDRSGVPAPANEGGEGDAPNVAPAPAVETPEAKAKAKALEDEKIAKAKAEADELAKAKSLENDPAAKAIAQIEEEEQAAAKARIAKRVAEMTPSETEIKPSPAAEEGIQYATKAEVEALTVLVSELTNKFNEFAGETQARAEENDELTELMATTVDKIASATASGFKPEARAVETVKVGGNSIFTKYNNERKARLAAKK